MSQAQKIKQLENVIEKLTNRLSFIEKRFGLVPDEDELMAAVDAMIENRDNSKLEIYLSRGGKIHAEGMNS